jgi:hypothetical protein
MVLDFEAALLSHRPLPHFNRLIQELFDVAAVNADDVVVVCAGVELEHRQPILEVMPADQASGFELGQHAIHGRQTKVLMLIKQTPVDLFGRQVSRLRAFKDFEDPEARQRHFQSGIAEVLAFHGCPWLVCYDARHGS